MESSEQKLFPLKLPTLPWFVGVCNVLKCKFKTVNNNKIEYIFSTLSTTTMNTEHDICKMVLG